MSLTCRRCGAPFVRQSDTGPVPWYCVECAVAKRREWTENWLKRNAGHRKAYLRDYYQRNRNKLRQRQHEFYWDNVEYSRTYAREYQRRKRGVGTPTTDMVGASERCVRPDVEASSLDPRGVNPARRPHDAGEPTRLTSKRR